MANEATAQDEDSLEIDGPAGVKARAKGSLATTALLIITGFAAMVAMGYTHHKEMKEDSQRVEAAVSEMVYMMSLTDNDRAKLRISMPDSLRQKIRRGRADSE